MLSNPIQQLIKQGTMNLNVMLLNKSAAKIKSNKRKASREINQPQRLRNIMVRCYPMHLHPLPKISLEIHYYLNRL